MELTPKKRSIRIAATEGVYYWYPTPNGGWDFEAFTGPQMHLKRWGEVLRKLAAVWDLNPDDLWNKLGNQQLYRGLPRGRVSTDDGRHWMIDHGGEFPLHAVRAEFGLNAAKQAGYLTEQVTEHETTQDRSRKLVEDTLSYMTNQTIRIPRSKTPEQVGPKSLRETMGLTASIEAGKKVSRLVSLDDAE